MSKIDEEQEPAFAITGESGFHLTFGNGWTVSVQFGPGTYGDHYDRLSDALNGILSPAETPGQVSYVLKKLEKDCGEEGSNTAEIAVLDRGRNLIEMPDGDCVKGYATADDLAHIIAKISHPDFDGSW